MRELRAGLRAVTVAESALKYRKDRGRHGNAKTRRGHGEESRCREIAESHQAQIDRKTKAMEKAGIGRDARRIELQTDLEALNVKATEFTTASDCRR